MLNEDQGSGKKQKQPGQTYNSPGVFVEGMTTPEKNRVQNQAQQQDMSSARSDLALKNYSTSEDINQKNQKKILDKRRQSRERKQLNQYSGGRSRSQEAEGEDIQVKKRGIFNRMFGKISKKEMKDRKKMSTETVKLPRNFADNVLNLELVIDSGNFDIDTVNQLMQHYSQAVEYYSGMNDVRYIHFTERIQNMLIRPEILNLMNDGQPGEDQESGMSRLERAKKARMNLRTGTKTLGPAQMAAMEQEVNKQTTTAGMRENNSGKKKLHKMQIQQIGLSQEEAQQQKRLQQELEQQKRKKRHEKLIQNDSSLRQLKDVKDEETEKQEQTQLDTIQKQKEKARKSVLLVQNDASDQRSAIQKRLAERKQKKMNRSVIGNDLVPKKFGSNLSNNNQTQSKSFIDDQFVPRFGARVSGTPDKVMDKSDIDANSHSNNSAINSKPNIDLRLREGNNSNSNNQDGTKGSSTTQIDQQIKDLQHNYDEPQNRKNNLMRRKDGAQTIILQSNNPFDHKDNRSVNFDIQSKTSANFFNEEEMQEFEEQFQARVGEIWTNIEKKQDNLQKDYQSKFEDIIEEVAHEKFEALNEIKQKYKDMDPEDADKKAEMKAEQQSIKKEFEQKKSQKLQVAQEELENLKKEIQKEKKLMLLKIKTDIQKEKKFQNEQDQQEINQVFDYINMDDGFDRTEGAQGTSYFGVSAAESLKRNKSADKLATTPTVGASGSAAEARAKFRPPEVKKHAALKKSVVELVQEMEQAIVKEMPDIQQEEEKSEEVNFDQKRERTFTFSNIDDRIEQQQQQENNGEADNQEPQTTEQEHQADASDDIALRKQQLKEQLMSMQEGDNDK